MNKSIADCLLNIIPEKYSWKIKLLESWHNIIGDLKKSVTIELIEENVLFLGVVHPAWAQELLILTPVLKQKINTYLEKEYIKTIRIRIRPVKDNNVQKIFSPKECLCTNTTPLTARELEALNCLKDENLRNAMQGFYLKCKGCKSMLK